MRIFKAVVPFICYAVAVAAAMEIVARAGGAPASWLLVSLPLLVLAYAEAGRAVGFRIETGRVVACALLGALGRGLNSFLTPLANTWSPGAINFMSLWIFVEVFVLAGLLKNNMKRLEVWVLVAIATLSGEWLLSWLLFGGDLVSPELALSVVEVQSMRGRFRVLSVVLLSADLVRNVGLFGLAYWWRDRAEVAKA